MVRRPQEHRTETDSRIAFESLIPKAWVYRPKSPDYGIDGEVELFDEAGNATGRSFLVQLKGSRARLRQTGPRVNLKRSTCEYFRIQQKPVLIVFYHSPTESAFSRWFHTYDPYHGRRGVKTTSFALSISDRWEASTPARLAKELEVFATLRSPGLPLPLTVSVSSADLPLEHTDIHTIYSALKAQTGTIPDVVELTRTAPPHAHPAIRISESRTVVDLAGLFSCTFHRGPPPEAGADLDRYIANTLVGIAVVLETAGHSSPAARVFAAFAPSAPILADLHVAILAARCFARVGRTSDALGLSERLQENEGTAASANALMLGVLRESDRIPPSELTFLLGFLVSRADLIERSGDRLAAAAAHYTLGNRLRSHSRRLAVHHYRRARTLDPTYSTRSYFWADLGGVAFEAHHYSFAERFYGRASDLHAGKLVRPLQADAALFAGSYQRAHELFDQYRKEAEAHVSEWLLKAWFVELIRTELHIDKQVRQHQVATRMAGDGALTGTFAREEVLDRALRYDALCGLAWFNLGALQGAAGRRRDAFYSFLCAALCQRHDVEAWCNCFAVGLSMEESRELLPHVLQAAHLACRDRFLDQVFRLMKAQPGTHPVDEFMQLMDEAVEAVNKPATAFELRLIDQDGSYHTIDLS